GEPVGVAGDVLTHVGYLVARRLGAALIGNKLTPCCEHLTDGAADLNRGRVGDTTAAIGRARDATDGRANAGERQGELIIERAKLLGVGFKMMDVLPAEPQPVGCAARQAAAAVATGAVGGVLATGATVGGGAERGVLISGHRSPRRGGGVWCMV